MMTTAMPSDMEADKRRDRLGAAALDRIEEIVIVRDLEVVGVELRSACFRVVADR